MVRSCIILLILTGQVFAQSPESAILGALGDAQRLPPDVARRSRYLTAYHLSLKAQQRLDLVLRFWVNSLSNQKRIVPPTVVGPGLWRIDCGNYSDLGKGLTHRWLEVWEKLLDDEPYFHIPTLLTTFETVAEFEELGNFYDGFGSGKAIVITKEEAAKRSDVVWRTTSRKPIQKQVGKTKEGRIVNPLIASKEHQALAALTNSQVPIVRADWWLHQTAAAKDRKAGYYEWLGLGKKEADFQKLVSVNVQAAKDAQLEIAAFVGKSSVTLNNRGLERFQGLTGGYWRSRDYAKSTGNKNVIRLIDGDAKHDATEQYGTLPNGLFAFWLGDGKGDRQDEAPSFIATDGKAPGTDRAVSVGVSCIRCHVEGIRPIGDWARRIHQPPFDLRSPDYEKQKRLQRIYLENLQELIEEDQLRYNKALKKANGLTPEENSKAFADIWEHYVERDRTLEDLAAEVGIKPDVLLDRLKVLASGEKKLDPILAAVFQGISIRMEHVEEIYPELLRIAR